MKSPLRMRGEVTQAVVYMYVVCTDAVRLLLTWNALICPLDLEVQCFSVVMNSFRAAPWQPRNVIEMPIVATY